MAKRPHLAPGSATTVATTACAAAAVAAVASVAGAPPRICHAWYWGGLAPLVMLTLLALEWWDRGCDLRVDDRLAASIWRLVCWCIDLAYVRGSVGGGGEKGAVTEYASCLAGILGQSCWLTYETCGILGSC